MDRIDSFEDHAVSVKELAAAHGMSVRALADRFQIPHRTMEDWSVGRRHPPEYVLRMMQELLRAWRVERQGISAACDQGSNRGRNNAQARHMVYTE